MSKTTPRAEPEDVYRELVDGLADNVVPMVVLLGLIARSGAYILSVVHSPLILVATIVSVLATLVKIMVILHHQHHRPAYRAAPLDRVRRHERVHAATTIAVCLSASLFSVAVFMLPGSAFHLLPIAITFGYSAGLIARVSIRPRIAGGAILRLGLPCVATMVLLGGQYLFVGAVWAIFLGAGLQSVGFVYVTARRAVTLRLELEALARHDPLTGLLNRRGLREACEALVRDRGTAIAVHALDLDGFKAVNDRLGHAAGDRLLATLAARIRASIPDGTIVARTGGDEFVVVQSGDDAAARHLAETMHRQLTEGCELGTRERVSVGLSLGYAVGQSLPAELEDLMQRADARSYAVKRAGGGIRGPGDSRLSHRLTRPALPERAPPDRQNRTAW